MRIHLVASAVAVLLTVGCAQDSGSVSQQATASTDVAAVRQAIEAANAGFIAAMQKGDSAAVAAFYDPDGMAMPHGMNASVGRGEIEKMFGGMLAAYKVKDMKLQIQDVVVGGDLAVETGRYEWTMVPAKGKPMPDKGKYVVVWRKQADGSWKLFRDIFNNDAPESAAGK